MIRKTVRYAAAMLVLAGCAEWKTGGNIGGANQGVRTAGNRQGGVALAEGDVAVSPDGAFFVAVREGKLSIGDVATGEVRALDNIAAPERVAFFEKTQGAVFLINGARDGDNLETVVSYDRAGDRVVWQRELARSDREIELNADGTRLLLTGADVMIADAATGELVNRHIPEDGVKIRDVDLTKDGKRVVITEDTRWPAGTPVTRMSVRNTDDGAEICEVEADNCADEVELTGDDSRALLAPTLCQMDPVSVIAFSDGSCEVEKQMPGFGPVALAPNGRTAVAFLDRDTPDPTGTTIPDDVKTSETRYHLMFIDMETLTFTTRPMADWLPRFAFSPDGRNLVIDTPMDLVSGIKLLDLNTDVLADVSGLPAKLHEFSFSPDATKAFLVDQGLFELDLVEAKLKPVFLKFMPKSVEVTPDGLTLVLTNQGKDTVHIVDAATKREKSSTAY